MRGGTRKVADSKPDVTSPTGDSIPMTFIGMFFVFLYNSIISLFLSNFQQNLNHMKVIHVAISLFYNKKNVLYASMWFNFTVNIL